MICMCTSGISKEDVVLPRLLYCNSGSSQCSWLCSQASYRRFQTCHWRFQTCRQRSQVLPMFSLALRGVLKLITLSPMVLQYLSSEIPGTLKAGRNSLLVTDTLLYLTHLSFHSTSSQILLESSSD